MTMIEGRSQLMDTRIQDQVFNPPMTMLVYQSFKMQGKDLIFVLQEDGAGRRCVLHKDK